MARHEADREDLFAELLSFPSRWEIQLQDDPTPVVAGIRHDGRLALYFGGDPAYHWNGENRLLRGFVENHLYRTQGRTLSRLRRERSAEVTELQREDLSDAELQLFFEQLRNRVAGLVASLKSGRFRVVREQSSAALTVDDLLLRLAEIERGGIALAPAYPTRRN